MALSTIPNNMQAALTSTQMPAGSVIQVVQTTDDSDFSMTGQTFTDFMSVAITPKFSTSKILVSCSFFGTGSSRYGAGRLTRTISGGSETAIGQGTQGLGSYRTGVFFAIPSNPTITHDSYVLYNASNQFLDSPSTTSAITYKIKLANTNDNSALVYANRIVSNQDDYYAFRTKSTLTAMEIAV
tara:strand:- start:1365 stop:1916 length:552 start_codon:yes stop_codon:yes gene_type:complete